VHKLTFSAIVRAVRAAEKCLQIQSMVYIHLIFPCIIRESLCFYPFTLNVKVFLRNARQK